ncbi:MAG: hypothetical protein ABIK09_10080 [Pseudomonadota bacterium]
MAEGEAEPEAAAPPAVPLRPALPPGPPPEELARMKQEKIAQNAAEIDRLRAEAMKAAAAEKVKLLAQAKQRITELYNLLKECCDELTRKIEEFKKIEEEAHRLIDETKRGMIGPAQAEMEKRVRPLIPSIESILEGFAIPSCDDIPSLEEVLRQVDHPEEITSPVNIGEIAKACDEARGKVSFALQIGQSGLDALAKTLKHIKEMHDLILRYAEYAYINLGHGRMDLVEECLRKIKAIDRREFGGLAAGQINRCINAVLSDKGYSKLIAQGYGECVRGYAEEGVDFINLARNKGAPALLTSFLIKQCKRGADREIRRCK